MCTINKIVGIVRSIIALPQKKNASVLAKNRRINLGCLRSNHSRALFFVTYPLLTKYLHVGVRPLSGSIEVVCHGQADLHQHASFVGNL